MIQPALLAGGSSRRFGSDKRFELVAGEPMVARVYRVASEVGTPYVLVADATDEARVRDALPPGARFLHDLSPGQGPLLALCGLLAALQSADAALLVAADLPNLNAALLVNLAGRARREPGAIVSPSADGRLQVGCTVYPVAALASARAAAAGGERSLTRWVMDCAATGGGSQPRVVVVEEPEWRTWGGGESPFFNLNTPTDRDRLTAGRSNA